MKFELKQNIFSTGVKKVDLSDKEAEFILALSAGIEKDKIMKCMSLSDDDVEKIYKKFGLKNKEMKRDIQLVTMAYMANFISEYCDKNIDKKFEFAECKELAEILNEIKKNDKEFKDNIMKEAEKIIKEHFTNKK